MKEHAGSAEVQLFGCARLAQLLTNDTDQRERLEKEREAKEKEEREKKELKALPTGS